MGTVPSALHMVNCNNPHFPNLTITLYILPIIQHTENKDEEKKERKEVERSGDGGGAEEEAWEHHLPKSKKCIAQSFKTFSKVISYTLFQ